LWEFISNIDFLLALVDEVASDSATRGALKDDLAFKNLRDVIKKCNKVLERMLIRRENKYTLFFSLILPTDYKEISKMKSWNGKVEKAVRSLSNDTKVGQNRAWESTSDVASDVASTTSASTETSNGSKVGLLSRGRKMLASAGRVQSRRSTPTPSMRNRFRTGDFSNKDTSSGDDGYATKTAPITSKNLAKLQQSLNDAEPSVEIPGKFSQSTPSSDNTPSLAPMAPKEELMDVIRNLQSEKVNKQNNDVAGTPLEELRPNWQKKAEIPTSVPKLPVEYIHRHRLMKQVVNSLLNTGSREGDNEPGATPHIVTSITSRHADKAGNGKTTLAVAAIQTVEIRENFPDGVAWIQLGRDILTEADIRRLYEELYDQLLMKGSDIDTNIFNDAMDHFSTNPSPTGSQPLKPSTANERGTHDKDNSGDIPGTNTLELAKSRRRFHFGDYEGMKEDLGRILTKKRVLICLDDVWRLEDANHFIFDSKPTTKKQKTEIGQDGKPDNSKTCQYRVLITTRTPGLLGSGNCNEVFVRILAEHEAVKLLLFSAGRRLHGGKNSPVFNQARIIVKGCGNSPLALRLAGGMLRTNNRNWALSSPSWIALVDQCKCSLEEASKIRSFVNSVGRIVDLSFVSISDLDLRTSLRRCFVTFAMVFRDNDWVLSRRGIPRGVIIKLFSIVISAADSTDDSEDTSGLILSILERMNLIQRAGHGATYSQSRGMDEQSLSRKSLMNGSMYFSSDATVSTLEASIALPEDIISAENPSYLMHDSIQCIAEDMAARSSASFAPARDQFTSLHHEIEKENQNDGKSQNWISTAAKYFLTSQKSIKSDKMASHQFHKLIVSALASDNTEMPYFRFMRKPSDEKHVKTEVTPRVENYTAAFLPSHLIHAQMFDAVSKILVDDSFITRRINAMGFVGATRRHIRDLSELRREIQIFNSIASSEKSYSESNGGSNSQDSYGTSTNEIDCDIDLDALQMEASKSMMDKLCEIGDNSDSFVKSLSLGVCRLIIGDGFFHSDSREAIPQFEEAVNIFRSTLGKDHVDVARASSVLAKAFLHFGESRQALTRLTEAAKIYKTFNASKNHDSIADSQMIASLLLDEGEWEVAMLKHDEVISEKRSVYGSNSLPVAKAVNEYAILLAKHSKMNEALAQYDTAKDIYERLSPANSSEQGDGSESGKYTFDITLIDLNTASIKSKIGDYRGSLASYERGVTGLRSHLSKEQSSLEPGSLRQSAQKRHLISAIGRIGSLKMKLKDNAGALEAYMMLLREVDKNSPTTAQMEKAKAHVKCATIYRQLGTKENNSKAVYHLKESFKMYSDLHGQDHKDTKSIASSLRHWQRLDEKS